MAPIHLLTCVNRCHTAAANDEARARPQSQSRKGPDVEADHRRAWMRRIERPRPFRINLEAKIACGRAAPPLPRAHPDQPGAALAVQKL